MQFETDILQQFTIGGQEIGDERDQHGLKAHAKQHTGQNKRLNVPVAIPLHVEIEETQPK